MRAEHTRIACAGFAILFASMPFAYAAGCSAALGITPVCLFERPEDLEPLRDGSARLVVSEYGALDGSRPGRLTLYDADTNTVSPLFPGSDEPASGDAGDPLCPGPPGEAFSPHGIHLAHGTDTPRLLVVNHGGREAVEIFELSAPGGSWVAAWRGCVPAPPGTWMNDVVGLPDGAFAVTHMMARGSDAAAIDAAERSKADTGYVLEWQPSDGWHRVAGSDGSIPNGIEASADGTVLFINYYFGDRVVALERTSGRRLWATDVDAPDNSSWTEDGRLLIASHDEDLHAVEACNEAQAPICPLAYTIVSVDPRDGTRADVVFGGGEPFGGATVAVELDGELFMGSFAGNRIARTRP